MAKPRIAAIVGAGPGMGAALSRQLTAQGWTVAALARRPDPAWATDAAWCASPGSVVPVGCDVTDLPTVEQAFKSLATMGTVSAMVYNAALLVRGPFRETTAEQFDTCWRTAAGGAFACAQQVLPSMLEAGGGTMIFTGATASLRGGSGFAAFASAKFALRGLSQALAREFGPQGIHVAHVVLDGLVRGEQTRRRFNVADEACMDPDAISRAYCGLIEQGPSAWTQELDLRRGAENY